MAISTTPEGVTAQFTDLIGLEVVELSAQRVEVRVPVEAKLTQPYGIIHGGVYCAIAETAASIGAATAAIEMGKSGAVGQSNHTDFLRATREGVLTGVATPVHVGGSVQLWDVVITDGEDRVVSTAKVRLFNLD